MRLFMTGRLLLKPLLSMKQLLRLAERILRKRLLLGLLLTVVETTADRRLLLRLQLTVRLFLLTLLLRKSVPSGDW